MTMPKKGRRELTIGNTLYHYKVGKPSEYFYEKYERRVTIQNRNTLSVFIATVRDDAVTPQIVKDIITERGL